jgi:hypothetical protein
MFKGLLKITAILGFLCWASLAFGDSAPKEKHQKVIDFEDEVVEGMNKRPLDSLNQISERNRLKKKPHLYRKRGGFKSETAESLRMMRYTPQ